MYAVVFFQRQFFRFENKRQLFFVLLFPGCCCCCCFGFSAIATFGLWRNIFLMTLWSDDDDEEENFEKKLGGALLVFLEHLYG